ncbi:type II toxin-antitoxin system VapB family antitoxin [Bosea caraganae]|uniref:Type II toxin-antitoxin system VapB family antitoxin n=1 Tax=Bosea caraganae TaxID=2763117 RepID=A0A370L2Z8_9HYPH|nr:type II toxin-antitoxin system VapB family antitoxin [Bosea caraganae]RDJ22450.1 type II toxin-antitoxin system VapB family antitoxin [Bosea caraganae]RDJ30409.1 type II toxin-antitoxin system VapB family antitoxin [Bosea caraganae]
MRTNIDIDDALLKEAMEATELSTKKAVVEEALRRLIENNRRRQAIKDLKGIGWEGDLDEMRRNFFDSHDDRR